MCKDIPGLVILGSKGKKTEQVIGSKPGSSTPSWPQDQLLHSGSCPVPVPAPSAFDDALLYRSVSEICPFLLRLLLAMVSYPSNPD